MCRIRDLKEVAQCIEELRSPAYHGDVVSSWVLESFEKKEKDRKELPGLLCHLSDPAGLRVFSEDQLLDG